MGKIGLYETDDIEERNVTLAFHDLFSSIAASGATDDPLELACRSFVRYLKSVRFAFYCYESDEVGKIAARKKDAELYDPPPDVSRKIVANLRKRVVSGVAVIPEDHSIAYLSPAQRKRWKGHVGLAMRIGVGGKPAAVLALFMSPDFALNDRHLAWAELCRDVVSALLSQHHAFVEARSERDSAMRAKTDSTLALEVMRSRIRQHLQELIKVKDAYRSGSMNALAALKGVVKSAAALHRFSNVSTRMPKAKVRRLKDKALDAWVSKGMGEKRIKAIVGVRGSNKSAILHAIYDRVLSHGVSESRLVFIDFEDARFRRFKTPADVMAYLDAFPESTKTRYLFLDEIGMVEWHVELLRRLRDCAGWNVWLASSTATAIRADKDIMAYRVWPDPSVPRSNDDLSRYWCEIFMRDVVSGVDHPDIRAKEMLAEYYSDHLGEVRSLRDISLGMAEAFGRTISRTSISTYRQSLADAHLIEFSEVYDTFADEVVSSAGSRAFYTDLELRHWRFGNASEDETDRLALNRMYLDLRRKYDKVYTSRDHKTDFITLESNGKPRLWKLPSHALSNPQKFRGGGGGG